MGQNAQTGQTPRGVITIDWMVMAVAAIALLFLIGTMIRTSVEVDPTADGGGLHGLGVNDSLLAFQDFSFDAEAWEPALISDDLPGLGPVLGPFSSDAVQRSFAMPTNARSATISFDVHIIGTWAEGDSLSIAVGEQEALILNATGENTMVVEAGGMENARARVHQRKVTPRADDMALGDVPQEFSVARIQLLLDSPPETLTLRLQAEAGEEAQWTLDTLSVVASAGQR